MRRLAHIAGLWLWIGFSGGALVLLFVASPLEHRLKSFGMLQNRIDLCLDGIILAWIVVSFFAAFAAELKLRTFHRRLAGHVAGFICCAVVFGVFLQAGGGRFGFARAQEDREGRFVFGAYPDEATLARLKAEGFSGVITLMSPLVPFEAVLLQKERAAALQAGLRLIEAPMLPWISSNRASLDQLSALAENDPGRYYVHCYLGRHRVDLARSTLINRHVKLPDEFERGPLLKIGESIIIGPYPTEDEWILALGPGGIRHVIALVTPGQDSALVVEEWKAAADLNIALHLFPAGTDTELSTVASFARAQREKVYIHSYLLDERTDALARKLRTE